MPPVDHDLPVTWTDLVEVAPGDRVVLVGSTRAATALRARGAEVLDRDAAGPPVDLVCVDGCRLSAAERRRLRGLLADHGRWVQISDNLLSPLRLVDVLLAPAPRAATHGSVRVSSRAGCGARAWTSTRCSRCSGPPRRP